MKLSYSCLNQCLICVVAPCSMFVYVLHFEEKEALLPKIP